MDRTPVKSSQIRSIGYDAALSNLIVEFNPRGTLYLYANVPPEVHAELMAAESVGKYFNAKIKGAYEFFKLANTGGTTDGETVKEQAESTTKEAPQAATDSGAVRDPIASGN